MTRTQMTIFLIGILLAFGIIRGIIIARKMKKVNEMDSYGMAELLIRQRGIKVGQLNGKKNPGFGYNSDGKGQYTYVYLEPGQNNLLFKYISKKAYIWGLVQFGAGGSLMVKEIKREVKFFAEANKRYQVEFNPDIFEFVISDYCPA